MSDNKNDPRMKPLTIRQRVVLGTVAAGVEVPVSGQTPDPSRCRPASLLGRGYLKVDESGPRARLVITRAGRQALKSL